METLKLNSLAEYANVCTWAINLSWLTFMVSFSLLNEDDFKV